MTAGRGLLERRRGRSTNTWSNHIVDHLRVVIDRDTAGEVEVESGRRGHQACEGGVTGLRRGPESHSPRRRKFSATAPNRCQMDTCFANVACPRRRVRRTARDSVPSTPARLAYGLMKSSVLARWRASCSAWYSGFAAHRDGAPGRLRGRPRTAFAARTGTAVYRRELHLNDLVRALVHGRRPADAGVPGRTGRIWRSQSMRKCSTAKPVPRVPASGSRHAWDRVGQSDSPRDCSPGARRRDSPCRRCARRAATPVLPALHARAESPRHRRWDRRWPTCVMIAGRSSSHVSVRCSL